MPDARSPSRGGISLLPTVPITNLERTTLNGGAAQHSLLPKICICTHKYARQIWIIQDISGLLSHQLSHKTPRMAACIYIRAHNLTNECIACKNIIGLALRRRSETFSRRARKRPASLPDAPETGSLNKRQPVNPQDSGQQRSSSVLILDIARTTVQPHSKQTQQSTSTAPTILAIPANTPAFTLLQCRLQRALLSSVDDLRVPPFSTNRYPPHAGTRKEHHQSRTTGQSEHPKSLDTYPFRFGTSRLTVQRVISQQVAPYNEPCAR